jgi:hypothetical protein
MLTDKILMLLIWMIMVLIQQQLVVAKAVMLVRWADVV